MPGRDFLFAVMFVGAGFFGFGGLIGLRHRQAQWTLPDAINLRLALEYSLAAVIFALLPFPLYYIFGVKAVIWGLSSFLLALFLMTQTGRVFYHANLLTLRWPLVTILLLVLSVIFLTIEFVNTLRWSSMAGYAWGLLWILGVAGVQFVAFICYERPVAGGLHPGAPVVYGYRGALADRMVTERVRGGLRPADPDRTPDSHADVHPNALANARLERYTDRNAFTGPGDGYRRPVTHTAVRPNTGRRH